MYETQPFIHGNYDWPAYFKNLPNKMIQLKKGSLSL